MQPLKSLQNISCDLITSVLMSGNCILCNDFYEDLERHELGVHGDIVNEIYLENINSSGKF